MFKEPKLNQQEARKVKLLAAEILSANLREHGNCPTRDQECALNEIIDYYVDISIGNIQGRYAFALPTGLGKTQSIIAFISAVNELGYDNISVAVCASKVEALCRIQRDLEANGVPGWKIGLVHSYNHAATVAEAYRRGEQELPPQYASLPATDPCLIGSRQFLLLTHQRVKGKYGISSFNLYQDEPRDLFIWDESLIVSDTFSFDVNEIASGLAYYETLQKGRTETREQCITYLRECYKIIDEEMKRQKEDCEGNAKPRVIRFSTLDELQISAFKGSLGEGEVAEPLKGLLDVSQEELRVLTNVEQGGGVVTFDLVVPKELKNMVILDASFNIRELANMDDTVKAVAFNKDLVSYENLVVNQLRHPSGRTSMKKEFSKKQSERAVTKEIALVVKRIRQDEAVLIFVFKMKGGIDYKKILLKDLERSGVDTRSLIKVKIGDTESLKPRIVVLGWGDETSLSQYKYCSNVILTGVLHRSHLDIGSAIVGQKQDLTMPLTSRDIRRVLQSETIHCIYQAISRGSCRIIDGPKTHPMNVWMIHSGDIRHLIAEVMPGLNWREWKGSYLQETVKQKARPMSEVIRKQLELYVKQGLTKVSTNKIKKDLKLTDAVPRTFFRALNSAIQGTPWERMGGSIVRYFEYIFGNPQANSSQSAIALT